MPTFKLDGQEIPFEKGETIIGAANRAGVMVPHYCWHPGLSVAANCRMCLVEIEPATGQRAMMLDVLKWDAEKQDYVVDRKPKLAPACQTSAGDGMVVKSESSPHVALARKSGIADEKLLQVLGAGLCKSGLGEVKWPKLVAGDWKPSFFLRLHDKDLGLAMEAARAAGCVMPVGSIIAQLFRAGVQMGFGGLDNAAVARVVEAMNGLHEEGG